MKYLIYGHNYVGAVIDMPAGVTGDGWCQIQEQFVALHCPRPRDQVGRYAEMIQLSEHDRHCGIYYDWELHGSGGANFRVLALPGDNWGNVRDAVAWIRRERDVVQLTVVLLDQLVEFQAEVDEIAAKNREPATQTTANRDGRVSANQHSRKENTMPSLAQRLEQATKFPFKRAFSDGDCTLYFGKVEGDARHRHASHAMWVAENEDGTFNLDAGRENKKYGGSSGGRVICTLTHASFEETVACVIGLATTYGIPDESMQDLL